MAFTLNSIASNKENPAAKRGDSIRVHIDAIKIVDGLNERDFNSEKVREHIASIVGSLIDKKPVPALEVWVNPDSGDIELVDGECRYHGYKEFQAAFPDRFDGYISAEKFEGTPAQRKARVATSNSQLQLEPIQRGRVYISLRDDFGYTRQQIAAEVNKSLAHVDQLILLAGGSAEVLQAVEAGQISSTEAVKLTREFGDDAPAELERRKEAAKEAGKDRVTAKVAAPKKSAAPSRPKIDMVVSAAVVLVNRLNMETLADLDNSQEFDAVVPSFALADLIHAINDMREYGKALDADKQEDLFLDDVDVVDGAEV